MEVPNKRSTGPSNSMDELKPPEKHMGNLGHPLTSLQRIYNVYHFLNRAMPLPEP